MKTLDLTRGEIDQIRQVAAQVMLKYDSTEDEELLHEAVLYAQELPVRLRKFLHDFKMSEVRGGTMVSGFPIDDLKIGKTMSSWKDRPFPSPTLEEEIYFLLLGSLLGDIFGWSTQQSGFIMHNLLPMKGYENEQMGVGSEGLLWWHTEEAFHPYRPDYLGLMCLRNPERVATTFSSMEDVELDEETIKVLFERRFIIRPDESHFQKHNNVEGVDFSRIEQMNEEPEPVAVLFGDPDAPYLRIDPFFMETFLGDEEAAKALNALSEQINANLQDVALQPGDVFFIDNFRAVHGRKPFSARFDGNDRWLKRIVMTRDLRKSRDARASAASRILI